MSIKLPMAVLGLILAVASSTTVAADESAEALSVRLKEMYPATKIERVQRSEIPSLFEVVMGKNAAYTDATGRYFVFGHLFDMKEQRDLTAERVEKAARVAFGELPLADAIKIVRGKGERVLAVFSDPDCPYCRRWNRNSTSSTTSRSTPFHILLTGCTPRPGTSRSPSGAQRIPRRRGLN
jgi:thiol:disulfide interchange protein DsbC